MTLHAIRGATQIELNTRDLILEATGQLVTELMVRNDLTADDLISVIFTATPDLTEAFPALGARRAGWTRVPMMCATEIAVPGAPPRIVRMLAHADLDRPRGSVSHVYLRGAAALRPDLALAE
ncbi:chorismate mutase [Actinomadura macrotermitis]|uniref:chorismate mutase n=1 Tax=Actinomadura macrotermitis TaxID=2585200 RepID=A0A7K0BPE0_9ACTN|nr:chorismate mutase [Actinomadura macrotermitis]MQY03023.1 Chorismate mutase AroH [Actinomadura macrotermitis]